MARILIIDDNTAVNNLLKRHLEREDHEISLMTAMDGLSIETRFLSNDLVLINLHYQGNGGWEMFDCIKRKDETIPAMVYVFPKWSPESAGWIAGTVRESLKKKPFSNDPVPS